ncbi:MAG: hypothetical protein QOE92_2155 [Chloroflexota bacterium]|jgi:hypothetical protein|nr:hypothetical protein [Chloroflexota bacterium]
MSVDSTGGPEKDSLISDLRLAVGALAADPRLPLLTLLLYGLWAIPYLLVGTGGSSYLAFVSIPVLLFMTGFYGTQRIWYLRVFRGQHLGAREVWTTSWAMFRRFAIVGIVVGLPYIAIAAVAGLLIGATGGRADNGLGATSILVIGVAWALVVDFLLTFVAPALAYTTRTPERAMRIGWRMIKSTWPRSALYVFLPPLAFQLACQLPRETGSPTQLILLGATLATAMINLVAKGAIAAFYLRRAQVADDGALTHDNPDPYDDPIAIPGGSPA